MWDELADEIAFQRGELHKLVEFYCPLIRKCSQGEAHAIEIPSVG